MFPSLELKTALNRPPFLISRRSRKNEQLYVIKMSGVQIGAGKDWKFTSYKCWIFVSFFIRSVPGKGSEFIKEIQISIFWLYCRVLRRFSGRNMCLSYRRYFWFTLGAPQISCHWRNDFLFRVIVFGGKHHEHAERFEFFCEKSEGYEKGNNGKVQEKLELIVCFIRCHDKES